MVPSLAFGGAERIVVETLRGLLRRAPTAKLFVLHDAAPSYDAAGLGRAKVIRLQGLGREAQARAVAFEVMASPSPVVFTHLIKSAQLRTLWDLGVTTVPVVHNLRPAWQDEPSAYDVPNVPFVAAVSDSVAGLLRASACAKPVVVVRHELRCWFVPDELRAWRQLVRERHAIPKDTLHRDGRRVQVAEGLHSSGPSSGGGAAVPPRQADDYGGWDHEWGYGRAAYTAACRQALEPGVIADLLTPGAIREVDPFYAAFDVFLNTSVIEGLSVSALATLARVAPSFPPTPEATARALPSDAVIVEDPSDVPAYAAGIERAQGGDAVPSRSRLRMRISSRVSGAFSGARRHEGKSRRPGRRDSLPDQMENLNLGGADALSSNSRRACRIR